MSNETELERLRKEGYTEEQIRAELDGLSRIDLEGRSNHDKNVYISTNDSDPNNVTRKRNSIIMLGKNDDANGKIKIDLSDGTYISEEEVAQALVEAIFTVEKPKIVVSKRTGEIVDEKTISNLLEIVKKAGKVTLGARSSNIPFQDTMTRTITGKGMVTPKKAGVLMLGNTGIKLPMGDYVNVEELKNALDDYIVMVPPQKKDVPVFPNTSEKNETSTKLDSTKKKKVIKRKKSKEYLIIALLIALILSGLRIKDDIQISIAPETIITQATVEGANLILSNTSEEEIERIITEKIVDVNSKYGNGEGIQLSDGTEYHESSDYKYGGANATGEIGQTIRLAGSYTINGLSVLNDGHIVDYTFNNNENLGSLMERVALEQGVSIQNLESYIHVDGPTCGWVDVSEISNINNITEEEISKYVVKTTYEASVEDISTNIATFTNSEGENVIVNLIDENGNFIVPGAVVVASDGKEYKVEGVEKKETEKNIATTSYTTTENVIGKKITWSFTDMSPLLGIATVAAMVANRKKESEAIHLSREESALADAQARYYQNSAFTKIKNKLTGTAPNWDEIRDRVRSGEMSIEDVNSMYVGIVRR